MEQHYVKIRSIERVTHDVLRVVTERPDRYTFTPGQATEIAVNKDGWQDEKRPFTFTSLPDDGYLEFTIKTYPAHKGVTNELLQLKENDELILHEVFGTIAYKGEGIFIAGGAGITPFISIFKQLRSTNETGNNKLIFANKTKADIILQQEFKELLGNNFINILSDEIADEYLYGHITKPLLANYITGVNQKFYICGPDPMMDAVEKYLIDLQVPANSIIKEEF